MSAKLFIGSTVRRLRRRANLSQVSMAQTLGISSSYLNLIEADRRPVSAALLLRIGTLFDVDPRTLAEPGAAVSVSELRARLAQPLFAGIDLDAEEAAEWIASHPAGVAAFIRATDALRGDATQWAVSTRDGPGSDPVRATRQEIERWHNHFADIDAWAETLSDELRKGSDDLYSAIADRLRAKHKLSVRILPYDVMPDRLRRVDLHARQIQLSEMLQPHSRLFQLAVHIVQLEGAALCDAVLQGSALTDPTARKLMLRHLTHYAAAAMIMPYGRFLRACEASGYDMAVLKRRFNAGFEQVAHRLTTLQRVGARGLPFFMLRIDRAGQVSKCYAGASASPLANMGMRCPLWNIHRAFDGGAQSLTDIVQLEDGSRWATLAQPVQQDRPSEGAPGAQFVVVLGLDAALAEPMIAFRGRDVRHGRAMPIGLGCAQCTRTGCPQRSLPPASRPLVLVETERGLSPFDFVAS